jgi:hypothetical protein
MFIVIKSIEVKAQSLDDIIKLLEPIFKQVTIIEETENLKLKHKGYKGDGIDKTYILSDTNKYTFYSYRVHSISFWVSNGGIINTAELEILADESFLNHLKADLGTPQQGGWRFFSTNQSGNGTSLNWKYKSYPVHLIIFNSFSTVEEATTLKFVLTIVPEQYWPKKN